MAAVMNAMWDLAARLAGKPLWRLLAEMTPEELVDAADMRYLSDALTPDEAVTMLGDRADPDARIAELERRRVPVLHDQRRVARLRRRQAAPACGGRGRGYRHVKLKVGADLEDDIRRCASRER